MGDATDILHGLRLPLSEASRDDELGVGVIAGELPDGMPAAAVGRLGDGARVDDTHLSVIALLRRCIPQRHQLIMVSLRLVLIRPTPQRDDFECLLFHGQNHTIKRHLIWSAETNLPGIENAANHLYYYICT